MFKKICLLFALLTMFLSFSKVEAISYGTGIAEGLNYSVDDFHNRTLYYGRFDSGTAALYLVVSVNNVKNKPTMYVTANCAVDSTNWQYFDKIYITTDSNSYVINCDASDLQYTLDAGMLLEQNYQKEADEQTIGIFRDIASSKGIPTCWFSGKYEKIRKITPERKDRMKKLIALYDFYNEKSKTQSLENK